MCLHPELAHTKIYLGKFMKIKSNSLNRVTNYKISEMFITLFIDCCGLGFDGKLIFPMSSGAKPRFS